MGQAKREKTDHLQDNRPPPKPNNNDVKGLFFKRLNFRGREINRRESRPTGNPIKQPW